MITWSQHDAFLKEIKTLGKTIRTVVADVEKVKKLLVAQFFVEQTKGNAIGPGKIHRVTIADDISGRELWKVEVMTPNVKPSLWPRMWFMVDGGNITLLAIASHKANYDNNEMDRLAIERYRDMTDL